MNPGPLDLIPLWAIFAGTVAIILASVTTGLYLGRWKRKRSDDAAEAPVGAAVGATCGLLAFILAFTFSMSASRFDARRELLLNDINAIGTTYLRAGLLPEPHKGEVRDLLRKYVDLRVDLTRHPEKLQQVIRESDDMQDRIWRHAEAIAQEDLKNPDIVSQFIDALNQMIDIHTSRVTALSYRIPPVVWAALYILTIFSMIGVGYQFGLHGKGNIVVVVVMSVSFASVILMNVDLDNPAAGWLKINQRPMLELQSKLTDTAK
ncbi:MAG TPA: DUF4239 domain-containing protein [bacterium]|nr:DUF4239 domain-containing protein [bacterium]